MATLSSDKNIINQLFLISNTWKNVLYIHTPFCERKCCYCIYSSKVPRDNNEIKYFYSNVLLKQIEFHQSLFRGLVFDEVYFGGGTPNIFSADELNRIFDSIPNFKEIPFKAIESSPSRITEEHIDLYGRFKFNYVSLGIQSTNPEILDKQNRKFVPLDKLSFISNELEKRGITCNMDLIFYMNSGDLNDLIYSEKDLEIVMNQILPQSLTLHYNYLSPKTIEKRRAMINLIKRMILRFPEYSIVNSLLEENEIEYDMLNGAEYRLMRKNQNMIFYLTSKSPQSHNYGYNMLSLGEYEKFKLRYNYYFLLDFVDSYSLSDYFKKYYKTHQNLTEIRHKLGLRTNVIEKDFFRNHEDELKFNEILKKYNLPFLDFSKQNISYG